MNAKTELDSTGLLVKTDAKTGEVLGTAIAKHPALPPAPTMRAAIRKLSQNGEDYLVLMDNIARGNPFTRTLPPDANGKVETYTVFPSLELQAHTANALVQMLHGKPVPQTEIVRAEEQAQQLASKLNELQHLSTDELMKRFESLKVFLPVQPEKPADLVIDVPVTPITDTSQSTPQSPTKKRGRPKGSKNKPKTSIVGPLAASPCDVPTITVSGEGPTVLNVVPTPSQTTSNVSPTEGLMSAIQSSLGKKVGT